MLQDFRKENTCIRSVCRILLRQSNVGNGCKKKNITLKNDWSDLYLLKTDMKNYNLNFATVHASANSKHRHCWMKHINKQIINGHSVHHVWSITPDEIMYREIIIYNYIIEKHYHHEIFTIHYRFGFVSISSCDNAILLIRLQQHLLHTDLS